MSEYKDFSSSHYLYGTLNALGVEYKSISPTRIRVNCPICGANSKVELHKERTTGRCWACSAKFNLQSYVASSLGISNKEAYKWLCDEFFTGHEREYETIRRESKAKAAIEPPKANLANTNKVYRFMMGNLSLTDAHIEHLKTIRGLTDEEIKKLEYFSFNSFNADFIKEITKNIPEENLKDVPGLFRRKEGLYTDGKYRIVTSDMNKSKKKRDGIFVPYKNIDGDIVGFQIRKNNEDLRVFKDGKKENKYKWYTSAEIEQTISYAVPGTGTTPGAPMHYACEFIYDFYTGKEYPYIEDGELWLTEGAMKADIAHVISKHPFVGIAGTKCIKPLIKDFPRLKELGVTKIVDCLDMDYLENQNVFKDRQRLKEEIEKAGIEYKMQTWNTECPDKSHKPLLKIDELYLWYKRGI